MKFFISLFLTITLFSFANANEREDRLMMVLESWNDANNAKDTDTLSRLYASKIIYYGSRLSREKCIKDKKRLFNKYPYFTQAIENAAFTSLNPNLYKIIFDKYVRITPGKKYKVYPSYVLVDTSLTFPAIVEEGDSITDKNIKRNNTLPTYTIGGVHEIKGKVQIVHHYGPPGYGEDPINDQKLTAYILKLDAPIKVVALKGDEVSFTTHTSEIQLAGFEDFAYLEEAAESGENLTLRGEFFSAHTGYHIRDVLMDISF